MKITVLGTGNAGSSIAKRAVDCGHTVSSFNSKASGSDVASSVSASDLTVLTIPFGNVGAIAPEVREALSGGILVDATNPLSADFTDLTIGFTDSAAEVVSRTLPGSRVVKAFNAVLAPNHDPSAFGEQLMVPVAGDDSDAKKTVINFVGSLGFDAVDAGALKNARYLEPLAELMVQLAYVQGEGNGIGLTLARRPV
ncbi:NADPH-dependent F420 reductase [Streptomyces sp. NPDC090080]|uniref:NADPH-dependent F420 reductase n=1 Tax=Streptomyces sp. NPDC090080 TaxID=3365939 RepID=UPI003823A885